MASGSKDKPVLNRMPPKPDFQFAIDGRFLKSPVSEKVDLNTTQLFSDLEPALEVIESSKKPNRGSEQHKSDLVSALEKQSGSSDGKDVANMQPKAVLDSEFQLHDSPSSDFDGKYKCHINVAKMDAFVMNVFESPAKCDTVIHSSSTFDIVELVDVLINKNRTPIVANNIALFSLLSIEDYDSNVKTLGAVLNLYAFLDAEFFSSTDFKDAFRNYGYQINLIDITSAGHLWANVHVCNEDLKNHIERITTKKTRTSADVRYSLNGSTTEWLSSIETDKYHIGYSLAQAALVIVGMFKPIQTDESYECMRNQWDTFVSIYGLNPDINPGPSKHSMPSIKCLRGIFTVFESAFMLRRNLFRNLLHSASKYTRLGIVIETIVNLCRFSGMTHIWLILKYVVLKHPYVCKYVSQESKAFKHAFGDLMHSQINDRLIPYLKVMHLGEVVDGLDRDNFLMLTYTAMKLRSRYTTSVRQYEPDLRLDNTELFETVVDTCMRIQDLIAIGDREALRTERDYAEKVSNISWTARKINLSDPLI